MHLYEMQQNVVRKVLCFYYVKFIQTLKKFNQKELIPCWTSQ